MELEHSGTIDKTAWDELVRRSAGTVFSLSAYLDATADDWSVLWNKDRSGGIACPFSVKFGVHVLYAPFFHRYTEWIGEGRPSLEQLTISLKAHFLAADAQLKWETEVFERKHQVVRKESYKPNQQARRMLKKAAGYQISKGFRKSELIELLKKELSHRIAAIDEHSLGLLDKLVAAFDEQQLVQLNLMENERWLGGVWLLVFNERVLYVKGTVSRQAKEKGGMYHLMEQAIQLALEKNYLFDFGGSNVEGVRRFNCNWGGCDVAYRHLEWNNAPVWWKTLKSLRKIWSRKSS